MAIRIMTNAIRNGFSNLKKISNSPYTSFLFIIFLYKYFLLFISKLVDYSSHKYVHFLCYLKSSIEFYMTYFVGLLPFLQISIFSKKCLI